MQPLTVETLRQATRGIRNMLDELSVRCEFFDRGCGKFVQLGDLDRHVADCGFAPAVCSNEGCQLEVNKQDLLHHETVVCELRRVQCHSCHDMKREIDAVKDNLVAMNEKLKEVDEALTRNETNVKAVEENVVAKVELVQEQLSKQEQSNSELKTHSIEMKKSLNEIMKQLERMAQQTTHEDQNEELKKGIAEGGRTDREEKVVIAGGKTGIRSLNSVEMFNLATGTWKPLQPMKNARGEASSVVYKNEIVVTGGEDKLMEKLSLNAVQVDQSMFWEDVLAELPGWLIGHRVLVHNGRLLAIGGYDRDKDVYSDGITEIPLVPPYVSKVLTTMPQGRCHHGVAIFGDKILVIGGRESGRSRSILRSVIVYDIIENQFQELAPLPYPVHEMATVRWGDDKLITMGGADSNNQPLNKVLMYNIKTQKSHELPNMKYKRRGCVAAVVRDNVIVMGGRNEAGDDLKSVEGFRFDRYSWEELPPMHKARCWATAVVC